MHGSMYLIRFLLPFLLAYQAAAANWDAEPKTLYTQDAGRRMVLGSLYDARSGMPVPGFLWDQDTIGRNTVETNASYSQSDFVMSDTLRDKGSLTDFSLSLTLSGMFSVLKISGTASIGYFTDKQRTRRAVRMTMKYGVRTVKQQINPFDYDAMKNINQHVMGMCDGGEKDECKLATHVVTGVTWGADTYALFESVYKKDVDRQKIEVGLAARLELPVPIAAAEAAGGFSTDEEEIDISTQTTVKIYGDFPVRQELPVTLEDTVAFMKSLPTKVLNGDRFGVPMEIELTPLVWLNSKAGKLAREIENKMLEELITIYESFDDSEMALLDLIEQPYGLFRAWKTEVDALYLEFQKYRSTYSSALGRAMNEVLGGKLAFSALRQMITDFYASAWNPLTLAQTIEQHDDTIRNLMALLAEFDAADIVTARRLSDFFSATFDSRYDRVYALVLVGSNPSRDRSGIDMLRKFVSLAQARKLPSPLRGQTHCVVRRNAFTGADECMETLKFVAIHFDAFCREFCQADFCPQSGQPLNCPTTSADTPPCEISADAAQRWFCSRNAHTGKCGVEPEHGIANNARPFSDCWCACPKTQVLEYVRSQASVRLKEAMPVVPPKPEIASVDLLLDMEPEAESQLVRLNVVPPPIGPPHIEHYKVIIVWKELPSSGTSTTLVKKQRVMYTRSAETQIWVSGLVAGAQYQFGVAGINGQGEGPLSDLTVPQTVGFTMATLTVISPMTETPTSLAPPINSSPNWMARTVEVRLSLPAVEAIDKVTLHEDFVSQATALGDLVMLKGVPPVHLRCGAYATSEGQADRLQSITCTLPKQPALAKAMQLRAWNTRNELIGMSDLTLAGPSPEACRYWGLEQLYCVPVGKCVADCDACKALGGGGELQDTFQFGSACDTGCPAGQIYCAKTGDCVQSAGDIDITCKVFCDGLSTLHVPEGDEDPYCVMPCGVALRGSGAGPVVRRLSPRTLSIAYKPRLAIRFSMYAPSQASVEAGATQTIACGFGYVALRSPASAGFTCPATRKEQTYTAAALRASGVALPTCVRATGWLQRAAGRYYLRLDADDNWARLSVHAEVCEAQFALASGKFEPQAQTAAAPLVSSYHFCTLQGRWGHKTLRFPRLRIVGCPKKGDRTVRVRLLDGSAGYTQTLSGTTGLSLLGGLAPEWGLGLGCGGMWPRFRLSLAGTPFGHRMPGGAASGAVCPDAQTCFNGVSPRPFGTQGCRYAGWGAPEVGEVVLDVRDQAAFDSAFPDTAVCP